jgi:hypothetical protein
MNIPIVVAIAATVDSSSLYVVKKSKIYLQKSDIKFIFDQAKMRSAKKN